MTIKKSKVVSIVLSLVLVSGSVIVRDIYAVEIKKEQLNPIINYYEITPFWVETNRVSAYISSEGTILYPEVNISGTKNNSSISGTMYLEKYVSGTWRSVKSWSFRGIGKVRLEKSYAGKSGTKYRTRVSAAVNGETVTSTSGSCWL